ncbi:VOC family protein [Roseomonas sp. AR75]|jgi:catechol 2,3-dioxygenase-like lactoylglutathione lyase family enzyme|uniref:VOC family protein n=1 Tax=Roseomonas sp. AR75 TaxID=2562311 RepID=UPI001F0DFF67|nr:VOC family protein [Roseomonas sp. AR75]
MARSAFLRESAAMQTYRFDHLHLRSPDPEAAARVWTTAFGAEVKARMQAGPWLRIVLDLAGVTLFIEQVAPGTHAPPAPPFLGLEHLGLGTDDLDAAIADLAAKGVPLVSGPAEPRPGVRIAFFAMPDGARVELIERRA